MSDQTGGASYRVKGTRGHDQGQFHQATHSTLLHALNGDEAANAVLSSGGAGAFEAPSCPHCGGKGHGACR